MKGKVAIVTGASSGIGRATAERLAADGVRVVVAARREDRLRTVAENIRRAGGVARALPTDVTQAEQVERLVAETLTAFGRVDLLINNAGVGYFAFVESTPPGDARRLLDVNVMGTLHGIRAVVPVMRRQGSGHIINVSSIVGKRAMPGGGIYAATKSAQIALSEALRLEMRHTKIRVSVICPVATATEFHSVAASHSPLKFAPAGPVFSPERVAAQIVRCVLRPRPEVMIYRPARMLVILNAIVPGWVDRILSVYWRKARIGEAALEDHRVREES